MTFVIGQDALPSAPSGNKGSYVLDSADVRVRGIHTDGTQHTLDDIGRHGRNYLVNSGFRDAQRQDPTTLTTYSNTTGRTYGPDYWTLTNENASVRYVRVDTSTSPVANLGSRYWGEFKKITNAGKMIVAQLLECDDAMPLRGRRMRFQMKAANLVGTNVLRLGILQLTSSGTADSIPATFVSAFGAAGTDPTWGTNLSAITPTLANANSSISGAGLSCTLSTSWLRFGGVFVVPSTCLNIMVVAWTNGQPAINDIFGLAEAGLYDGDEERDYLPGEPVQEFARCQRRCWKTFNRDTAPAQSVGNTTGAFRFTAGLIAAAGEKSPSFEYPVPMRAAPAVTTYNPAAANAQVRDVSAAADCSATTVTDPQEKRLFIACTGNASTAVGDTLAVHMMGEDNL